MKRCSRCEAEKPRAAFHIERRNKSGLAGTCKACVAIRLAQRLVNDPGLKRRADAGDYARHRDARRLAIAKWKKANAAIVLANTRKRKADKLSACPPWADLEAIKAKYKEAKRLTEETGIKHHVDHEYPLRHPLLCGLHVDYNLQVLTATENLSKGNRVQL